MMQPRRRQYLREMGIPVWLARTGPPPAVADTHTAQPPPAAAETRTAAAVARPPPLAAASALAELAGQVSACCQCGLHETRTQTVFGCGNPNADWLIIGEAPGADEDRRGEPFVGRAGKLLNAMLLAIGLKREQVFIANILKCRPPKNRDPKPAEVAACSAYLRRQIALIRPRLILAVGRVAAQNLLMVDTPIGKLRGKRYRYPDTELPVFVTYHPAYLLRSPREKRKVWEDLKLALRAFRAPA